MSKSRKKSGFSGRRTRRSRHHADIHESQGDGVAPIPSELPMVPRQQPEFIVEMSALEQLVEHVRSVGSFAFDTEFIGEETYYPRICLLQVATTEQIALVDPLVLEDESPIWELVADESIETIVHAGEQDVEPTRRLIQREPANIIDIQVAAAFSNMPYPSGLGKIIEHLTGHVIGKAHTFTDWDARPLSESQLRYAADDVRFLPLCWSLLRKTLEGDGRVEWARRRCDEVLLSARTFDPEPHMRRILRGHHFKKRKLSLLREMVLLRNEIARELDRPHKIVMSDETVFEIVRSSPRSKDDLMDVPQLPRRLRIDFGDRILALTSIASDLPPHPGLVGGKSEETASQRMQIDALWSVFSTRCLAMGIAPGMIMSRSKLGGWYRGRLNDPDLPVFDADDWRSEAAGDWLREFVAGRAGVDIRWTGDGPTTDRIN